MIPIAALLLYIPIKISQHTIKYVKRRSTVKLSVSRGRLSRHFHPSRRIVPYPRYKTLHYLAWKPLGKYGFSIIWPEVFPKTGIFTPCPRVFPSRPSAKAFAFS
ncbi:unnamed protein product [Laminaria digitata]